jgi:DNA-binding MarR family transcriptional regulator
LWAVFEEFRKIDPKFPMQWASAFAFVAENGEPRMSDLERALGLSQTTVSGVVLGLSSGLRPGDEGHELVETFADPEDRRSKRVRLSPKGRRVKASLDTYFNGRA